MKSDNDYKIFMSPKIKDVFDALLSGDQEKIDAAHKNIKESEWIENYRKRRRIRESCRKKSYLVYCTMGKPTFYNGFEEVYIWRVGDEIEIDDYLYWQPEVRFSVRVDRWDVGFCYNNLDGYGDFTEYIYKDAEPGDVKELIKKVKP